MTAIKKNKLDRLLKKSNEAKLSILTVIITLLANILFMPHLGLIQSYMLYLPALFIAFSFYFIIKHKVYKQEVSHSTDSYSYIEDAAIPKLDRLIIFLSMTVGVWMVLTTGTFLKLFVR